MREAIYIAYMLACLFMITFTISGFRTKIFAARVEIFLYECLHLDSSSPGSAVSASEVGWSGAAGESVTFGIKCKDVLSNRV